MKKQKVINLLKQIIMSIDFERSDNQFEKIFIKTEDFATIMLIKECYQFTVLKDIQVFKVQNEGFELNYILENSEDEEELTLAFIIKNKVSSVQNVFKGALEIEKKISNEYDIEFIN